MAETNPIRRFVKLVLDQAAAAKTEADAKKALGGVETGMTKLKGIAMKLGVAIASVFAVGKILDFGRAAVREAQKAEAAWSELAGVIEAVGGNSADMREEILAAGQAFQDVTEHDAEAYMESLGRMITLTGDVAASTQNMGLVADVAARFYGGELAPAVELVSKVMNGNTMALQRMGIQVETAQEGLEVLATRSFGAAADRAATFTGRLNTLKELWGDALELFGKTLIESQGATTALNFLTAAVKTFTGFIERNKEELAEWVTRGVNFAISAADVLYRATRGVASIIGGIFVINIARGIRGLNLLTRAYQFAVSGAAALALATGNSGLAGTLFAHAAEIKSTADSVNEYAEALALLGREEAQKGFDLLSTPVFTPEQFSRTGTRARPKAAKPVLSAAGKRRAEEDGELSEQDQALTEFLQSMDTVSVMSALLGDDFDALKAEGEALETVLASLAKAGVDENSMLMQTFAERLKLVRGEMAALEAVTKMEEEALKAQAGAAGELASALGAAMEGGLGPFAKQKARQNILEAAELTIRAGLALLTGFGAGRAGVFMRAAGKHAGLAAAWGALGASAGGSGGGGGTVTAPVSSGGTGGGLTPTTSRTVSTSSSARSQPMGAEVSVYLVGEGFDAANPRVQEVVRGATQEGMERYGPNTKVRVVRTRGVGS